MTDFVHGFEFAEEIIKISKSNSIVKGVDSKFYKTVAERPKYSVMNNSKIKKEYKILIKNWKLALLDFFKSL